MYGGWAITRWETPVVDIGRLLMVSLVDSNRELDVLFEAFRAPGRPRWRVRFRGHTAYRNVDEAYRVDLWRWLDQSGQRCGHTFTVRESLPFESWGTGYLHEVFPKTRHFVVATEEDVIEVLSAEEPTWELAEPASPDDPTSGKAFHLYIGEDDAEIERLSEDLKSRNKGG